MKPEIFQDTIDARARAESLLARYEPPGGGAEARVRLACLLGDLLVYAQLEGLDFLESLGAASRANRKRQAP